MLPDPNPIQILDTAIDVIAYKGERVVTFAVVDRVHQRPEGTAGRTFRENRDRFVEDADFIELNQPDEIRRLGFTRPQGGTPASIILITRRGYLKLVKPMSDDRAWAVQGEMIDRYFAVEALAAVAPHSRDAPGVATAFRSYFSIGELIGLDRNQAALAANRATRSTTGVDPLALMGATHLLAPQQAPLLTPTDLGKELGGLSAIAVNVLLADRGFQQGRRDAKDRSYWVPTESGERYAVFLDTGKKHSDGTPVRQLKWSADIVAALRETATADAPVA